MLNSEPDGQSFVLVLVFVTPLSQTPLTQTLTEAVNLTAKYYHTSSNTC